jgi:hypothetical protein
MELNINGRAYDGIDCKIQMLGNQAREVSAAAYGFTRDHQNNYGIGSDEPTSYSMGAKKYDEGSLTMSMREVVAIETAVGGKKDITKIKPFPTIFSYLNDEGAIVHDQVTWKFAGWGRSVNIDELGAGREFPMHVISIKVNV